VRGKGGGPRCVRQKGDLKRGPKIENFGGSEKLSLRREKEKKRGARMKKKDSRLGVGRPM